MAGEASENEFARRPPVEHRVLGLDRRSFLPAFVVIGIALLWAVLMPLVDRSVSYDDPVRAGDEMLLGPGLTFTPAVGWNIEKGLRASEAKQQKAPGQVVMLSDGGVTFAVTVGKFSGKPGELLGQIDKISSSTSDGEGLTVGGDREHFATAQGDHGVVSSYSGLDSDGVIAALVFNGTGVSITAVGPDSEMTDAVDDVSEMIESINYDAKQATAK